MLHRGAISVYGMDLDLDWVVLDGCPGGGKYTVLRKRKSLVAQFDIFILSF